MTSKGDRIWKRAVSGGGWNSVSNCPEATKNRICEEGGSLIWYLGGVGESE